MSMFLAPAWYNSSMSSKILIRILVVSGMIGLIGSGGLACSTRSNVNPADAALVRRIDETVERIRQAYTSENPDAFRAMLMPLESLQRVEAETQRDFDVYDRISVDFVIDRVMVEGSDVSVYFHWQGQWQRNADDQPTRERGHAVIRLVGHQNLTISGIEGDAPFGMASRRIPAGRPRER